MSILLINKMFREFKKEMGGAVGRVPFMNL
jgi:hypothetical protein